MYSARFAASSSGGDNRPRLRGGYDGKTDSHGHVYYNAAFTNPLDPTGFGAAKPAVYVDTRATPILDNPGDWEMSIVRFDTSSALIPLAVIPPAPGGGVPLLVNIREVGAGIDHFASVFLTDHGYTDTQLGLPPGSILTYQQLLDDINAAYAVAFATIAVPPVNSQPPQFIWNATEQLIDLFVDPSYVNAGAPAVLTIGMNQQLQKYLSGWDSNYTGSAVRQYELVLNSSQALLQPAVGARTNLPLSVQAVPPTLYKFQQQATVAGSWNNARSIIITSAQIPMRPEFVPTNITTNDNNVSTSTQRIVSDFLLPPETNPMQGRTILEYLPTAEYRIIDLTGAVPLYAIDLQMYWTDFIGNQYPVMLPPGATFSVKILFRKIRTDAQT